MKTIKLIAAGALILGTMVSPLAAPAMANASNAQGPNGELFDYCYELMASGDFDTLNLGECVGYNIIDGPGWRTKICDALLELDLLDLYGFDSFSDCVRNV